MRYDAPLHRRCFALCIPCRHPPPSGHDCCPHRVRNQHASQPRIRASARWAASRMLRPLLPLLPSGFLRTPRCAYITVIQAAQGSRLSPGSSVPCPCQHIASAPPSPKPQAKPLPEAPKALGSYLALAPKSVRRPLHTVVVPPVRPASLLRFQLQIQSLIFPSLSWMGKWRSAPERQHCTHIRAAGQ
ncbi:hypothetical protein CALCODRAFT_381712 [Calocera cornea HHB12733]|uniref:Uncharacterized protein n=1 Tax=Calocera cornea HHB12733 TaxID=1353952 RepID=A0A165EBK2_9BASI|nr:hypothetical protein CALCODRAFT_381712 [Calocera cornea HHB12733]